MTDQLVTKLGKTRAGERTRIWIEGPRLVAHGFPVGTFFVRVWNANSLVLKPVSEKTFDALARADRGRVSGKGDKPIIDITGQKVAETFGEGETVTVSYAAGRITIIGN